MYADGEDKLLRMLKNNGQGEELLHDAKSLLGLGGEKQVSSGFSTGSRNGLSMDRPSMDARSLLRRSRSISSTDDDTATAILPSPLMPSVRRLHSSPKTFGPRSSIGPSNGSKTNGPESGKGKELQLERTGSDKEQSKGKALAEGGTGKESQLERTDSDKEQNKGKALSSIDGGALRNVTPSNGSAGSSLSSLKSGLSHGNLPTRLPSGREVFPGADNKARLNLTRLKIGDDNSAQKQSGEVDLAQEARNAWKPRIRVENDGLESLSWPTKGHRTGAGVLGQPRQNGFAQTGNLARSGSGSNLSPPGRLASNSNRAEKKDEFPRIDGGGNYPRKRRIGGGALQVLQDEGIGDESSILDPTNKRSPTVAAGASNTSYLSSQSRQPRSYIKFLLQHQSHCSSIAVILLLIFCVLSILYAIAVSEQVMYLERRNNELSERVRECSSGSYWHEKTVDSIKTDDEEDGEEPNGRATRKFALFVSLFVLSFPFIIYKYVDVIPRLGSNSGSGEEEVPLSKRLAYRIDVLFSSIAFFKPLALLVATILLIGIGGIALFGVSGENLWDAFWRAWTYVADAGNHADSSGTGPRIVSICISFGGMLIFALMLGLVSDAISEKVDSLRKGKSEVIERNHTLVLGWSDKLGSLLKQLSIANQSLGGGVVVVLAELEKEKMELDIAKMEFDFMGTSVICRSGSPLIMADLKKVSVSKARAIIVLAEVENADQSDARVLRVVLSLTGVKEGLRGHIVVELSDLDNEQLVKLVGGDMVETVVAHDVIGRLMIQCARQPGLAQIWEDILGFDNAEFYVKRWPQLDGMRFEEVMLSFPDAIPCGVKVAARKGQIVLNPDDDYMLRDGDELLVIAEDDDTYFPCPVPKVRKGSLPRVVHPPKLPEKILFCGWRRDIDDMIMVLDAFLAQGSELWMFSEVATHEREKKLMDGGLNPQMLNNIKLVHREGNAVIRRHLESLPLETFDSILILADEALEDSVINADSRSLATLLLIRDIQSRRMPYKDQTKTLQVYQPGGSQWIREMQQASDQSIIISEILDSRTKHLVSVSKISDYVLSNELVSMALAMVAEDKQINRVLEELFAEEGNEMYIRPGEMYLYDQEELSFYDIMARARQRHEVVIGYRLATQDRAIINPPNKLTTRKWSLGDVFVVLAQDE
ncbi:unnamed protein product [Calypogeia fissa]